MPNLALRTRRWPTSKFAKEKHPVVGSPAFMLGEGRQKLYGNVGYRILEANIQEVLADPSERASWC